MPIGYFMENYKTIKFENYKLQMFLLWQASLRAVRKGNNCLTTAKIHLFSETRNFFRVFSPFGRETLFS